MFLWYDIDGDGMIKVIRNGNVITMDEARKKIEKLDLVINELVNEDQKRKLSQDEGVKL